MSFRLPFNVQRSTLNAQGPDPLRLRASALKIPDQRPTLELPNFRTPELSPRSGMTMIELVAALALFAVILGSLLTVMDTATSLWSSSRSQQREQATAENIAALVFDDLYEAVTDNGVPTNSASAPVKPTFILSSPPTNGTPGNVVTVLGFARHASPRTLADESLVPNPALRLSLDAVFYTYYNNALFRHVIPLACKTSFADAEPLGGLLEELRNKVKQADHGNILSSAKDPAQPSPVKWTCQMLAERVELGLFATLPGNYVMDRNDGPEPVTLSEVETGVLPDQVDLAFVLYSEEDWAAYQPLKNDTSASAELKKRHLGVPFSKRITFPSKGGSRLP